MPEYTLEIWQMDTKNDGLQKVFPCKCGYFEYLS